MESKVRLGKQRDRQLQKSRGMERRDGGIEDPPIS